MRPDSNDQWSLGLTLVMPAVVQCVLIAKERVRQVILTETTTTRCLLVFIFRTCDHQLPRTLPSAALRVPRIRRAVCGFSAWCERADDSRSDDDRTVSSAMVRRRHWREEKGRQQRGGCALCNYRRSSGRCPDWIKAFFCSSFSCHIVVFSCLFSSTSVVIDSTGN